MGPLAGSLTKRKFPGKVMGGMYISLLGACLGIVLAHKLGVEDQIGGYGWCWLGALLGGILVPLIWSLLGEKQEEEEEEDSLSPGGEGRGEGRTNSPGE